MIFTSLALPPKGLKLSIRLEYGIRPFQFYHCTFYFSCKANFSSYSVFFECEFCISNLPRHLKELLPKCLNTTKSYLSLAQLMPQNFILWYKRKWFIDFSSMGKVRLENCSMVEIQLKPNWQHQILPCYVNARKTQQFLIKNLILNAK